MGSSSSRSASFGHSHCRRRSPESSTSPYDSIEDERTIYYAGDHPPRWRRKHFLSANKSLAGRIAKHRKAVGTGAGAKSLAAPGPAAYSSSRMCRRRRKSSKKRNASDSGRGSDECDCDGVGADRASSDEGGESVASCRYCDEEEEEEDKKFVLSCPLRIEANLGLCFHRENFPLVC